jgi:D-hydroxyproline dehydrogenase subunit alpha
MSANGTQPIVAVVGAGPAGIAAARTLGQLGVRVTLLDEGPAPGGQYYKHARAASETPRGHELDELREQGEKLSASLLGLPVQVRQNIAVWGVFDSTKLGIVQDDHAEVLEPAAILFASGAIERVAAFPGWTLPGVMTAGGAQRLLSHEGILPGRRFVLAGTGPLLLAIATEIAEAGGDVAAVVDCTGLTEPVRKARTAWQAFRQPGRFRQWIDYRRALRRLKVPYLHNSTVVAAHGTQHVEQVEIAEKNSNWELIPGSEWKIEADTLCLHYGFAASVELPQVAGCELAYDPGRGGWYVEHDRDMRTSKRGIYVAGQLTGIGGADLAEATGQLAGMSIARDLGSLAPDQYNEMSRSVRSKVSRGRGFAEMLNTVYTPGPGIGYLVKSNTWLCRCEEVDAEQVDRALNAGATTLNDVKRHTRCGMGFCQGRICSQTLHTYLDHRAGVDPGEAGLFNARSPIKPVSLGTLATLPD